MKDPLVCDELWRMVESHLPVRPPRPKGGRPPVDDRKVLEGIVFVLRTGIGWAYLPQEMGCESGMTCWRRLRDWQTAGVWVRLHRSLLDRLGTVNAIDWSRACVDSASFAAKRGAERPRRTLSTAAGPVPSMARRPWIRLP